MRFTQVLAISLALTLPFSGAAIAVSKDASNRAAATTETIFTEAERRIICEYFNSPACQNEKRAGERADGEGGGKGHKSAGKKDKGHKLAGGPNGNDKRAMLPPGLAKRDTLPPGLAMQLEKNGTLPPGLAKRDLPDDLESKLPRRQGDLSRVIVGDDIVLIRRGTQAILDILEGVAARGN